MPSRPENVLDDLRRRIASIEACGAQGGRTEGLPRIKLGPASLDRVLGGGLPRGALHEVIPESVGDIGAASGFVMGLAALAVALRPHAPAVLHVQQEVAAQEAGAIYAAGLDLFGLDPAGLISIAVPRRADLLLAMEEALKCPALAIVVGELFPDQRGVGLTASRRLALAAEAGGGLGVLVRAPGAAEPGAAATRWEVRTAESRSDAFGGLGPPGLVARLVRSKLGQTGEWRIEWSSHEQVFAEAALPRDLVATPAHRPHRAAATGGGRGAG